MSQVTLCIDDEAEARTRAAAEAAGVSLSRSIDDVLRAKARTEWPADVVALRRAWRNSAGESNGHGRVGRPGPSSERRAQAHVERD